MNVNKPLGLLTGIAGRAARSPAAGGARRPTPSRPASGEAHAGDGPAAPVVDAPFEVELLQPDRESACGDEASRAETPGEPDLGTPELSEAGRMLQRFAMAAHAGRDGSSQGAHAGSASVPLVARTDVPTDEFATRLAQALRRSTEESGLFYESHLARWADGKRELTSLLREPQPRLDAQGIARLVREQMDALALHAFAWEGELWPTQSARLEWREAARSGDAATRRDDATAWDIEVTLDHPTLGALTAELSLDAAGLGVRLRCGREDARAALSVARDGLRRRLETSGLSLERLELTVDG